MITLEEIKKSVISLIKPLNIAVYGKSIKQGFKTPCFFVQLMPIESNTVTRNFSENTYTVEIVYFSENETDLENVRMYDNLRGIFSKTIAINERNILPQKLRYDTEDYVMSFRFDLSFYDDIPNNTPAADPAGEVIINLKGGTE